MSETAAELRLDRLESDVHDIKSTLGRLEPLIARIDERLNATLPHLATKAELTGLRVDVQASEAAVRSVLASETARLDTRIERLDATVKAQPNAIMLRLGTLMVVLTGIILAALRYWPPGHGG